MNKASEIPFSTVRLTSGLLYDRLQVHGSKLLPSAIANCVETGRIENFRNAGLKNSGKAHGEFQGKSYNDSDVYKVLEGIAYSLVQNPNPALEKIADDWIQLIASAQEQNGYLYTYYTLTDPALQWTDMEMHEDYCAGHLFEAAVAYSIATGKDRFLGVAVRLADHLVNRFLDGGTPWVVGHQGPELALVKLYHRTGNRKYFDLAVHFVDQRGRGLGKGMIWDKPEWGPAYCQDDVPASELTQVTGHAVRAMYYYVGIADLTMVNENPELRKSLDRLWTNVTEKNQYITGGIGSSLENEGFLGDYVLPNQSAYCETCASIGVVYWAHRMHLLTGESRYIDVLEKVLFNGVLSGLSFSGDRFFYVNPLESKGDHHREPWFDCSCCPTSLARFLPSVSGYLYAKDDKGISVNLFAGSVLETEWGGQPFVLRQLTTYPWAGRITLQVEACEAQSSFEIRIRVPSWARGYWLEVNGESFTPQRRSGYIVLDRLWTKGDVVEFSIPMQVEVMCADQQVAADVGRRALQRGPVVYCVEACDNTFAVPGAVLEQEMFWQDVPLPQALGDGRGLVGIGASGSELRLVPYFLWDNREPGGMEVWIRQSGDTSVTSLYRSALQVPQGGQ